MKNARKPLLILVAGFVAFAVAPLTAQEAKVPYLPGITTADEHPNGCVDCHKNQGEGQDFRLNVSLAKLGKHPKIDAIVKKLPEDCMMCHREGGKVSPLFLMLHKAHYENGNNSPFIKFYQGSCLNCHKLDAASGKMTVKSGPKNW
jgi:mono/diheme cytochrome c family protein